MAFVDSLDLMILMPVLAEKISKMNEDFRSLDARSDELSEAEENDACEMQETLHRYQLLLDHLESEYRSSFNERENLPSYEKLMERFTSVDV